MNPGNRIVVVAAGLAAVLTTANAQEPSGRGGAATFSTGSAAITKQATQKS